MFNAARHSHAFAFIIFVALLCGCKKDEPVKPPPDEPKPLTLNDFGPSETCQVCHPQQYEEWSGSRHRYAGNDPIWMLANNALQSTLGGKLGTTCWPCHAPLGYLTGNTLSTFQLSDLKPMVREGVSCDMCHIMRPPHTTTNGPIRYNVQPGNIKYGPMTDPIPTSGHENGYDATFLRSDVCRECHDLIVNNIPVEITNTELQNSPWAAVGTECQDCHMSTYTGQAAVGSPIRTNLHRHDFVAVSIPVTDFPYKAYQRAAGDSLLRKSASMYLYAPSTAQESDSITVSVLVYNDKTGHNIPTSVFFFRQMWLEVTVFNGSDTAYISGHLDANGDLMESHSALRPNADKDLALFSGTLYKDGVETDIVEMDSMVNNSIPAFGSSTAYYRFKVPRPGPWNVKARLLFRPYGPYLFRGLGADQYIPELTISEMLKRETIIEVR